MGVRVDQTGMAAVGRVEAPVKAEIGTEATGGLPRE